RKHRGAEYRVNYNHEANRATLTSWDVAAQDWGWDQGIRLDSLIEPNRVAISMPYHLIGAGRQFCWIARAVNSSEDYNLDLPADWLPNEEFVKLTRHEIAAAPTNIISGKLAVPLNNERGFYDVAVFALPGGQEIARIANARQPNFHLEGQRLLINHESLAPENVYEQDSASGLTAIYVFRNYNAAENIYEFNLADRTEKQVSDGIQDSHPFYNPQGDRLVYGNAALLAQTGDTPSSLLFTQCGLLPPRQEVEPRCRELFEFGMLTLAGALGEVRGNYPVWTSNDMIAYNGCGQGAERTACGIYLISAGATPGSSEGATPAPLTTDASDMPSDTQDNLLTFTSQRDGNWEAYLINLDGTGLRNVSNNPDANDGLPTLSPDGQWVAFVSDRQGSWAVWAVPVEGSLAQKLFDLPTDTPWGNGDRAWTNERISWGK
ncbi:MAG TPA: hypothetical protein VEC93_07855, partial [Anaerolineae bacterium]|nr:hypothetical protein [Anaerolineae bacterium]